MATEATDKFNAHDVALKLQAQERVADVPVAKLVKALFAISLGTIIEWYDFTIYTQLNKTLTAVFFPTSDPILQALSFWGVFFIGYISRPVGAVLFGHIGDTKGRGMCLLLSVLLMGIPTVLIGCLPSYHHIGFAAPIILAILRLIQGLAMGGEFGAAMVYLHEIATPKFKALTGSLGYVSLGLGVVIGILMVTLVVGVTSEANLLVWGWRIPFLLSICTLVVASVLRYNMPESSEFIQSREEIDEEYQHRLEVEVRRVARELKKTKSGLGRGLSFKRSDTGKSTDMSVVTSDNESEFEVHHQKHYVPLAELLRGHWAGILLQLGYEAWIGASFYVGYSWMPSFFNKKVGLQQSLTLWMVLTCMVVFTFVVPIAGWLSDKGMPRVKASLAIFILAGGAAIPMFLAFETHSLVACWLLQCFSLMMTAFTMGLLPCICASIYPAGVRISGFNLGYNLGMTLFGGCTPLIITAIQATGPSMTYYGPGIWLLGMAVLSIGCSLCLLRIYPETNLTTVELEANTASSSAVQVAQQKKKAPEDTV